MSAAAEGAGQGIRELLASLNEWEQQHGTTYTANPLLTSTGEANARIVALKDQLKARGVVFHWNGREYVIDTILEPNQGYQGPDTQEMQG